MGRRGARGEGSRRLLRVDRPDRRRGPLRVIEQRPCLSRRGPEDARGARGRHRPRCGVTRPGRDRRCGAATARPGKLTDDGSISRRGRRAGWCIPGQLDVRLATGHRAARACGTSSRRHGLRPFPIDDPRRGARVELLARDRRPELDRQILPGDVDRPR